MIWMIPIGVAVACRSRIKMAACARAWFPLRPFVYMYGVFPFRHSPSAYKDVDRLDTLVRWAFLKPGEALNIGVTAPAYRRCRDRACSVFSRRLICRRCSFNKQ